MRGEVWAKALLYCRQAGAKAMERSASREAVGCYEQALAALAHLPEHRTLREQAIDLRLDLYSARLVLGQLGASCMTSASPKRWQKPWTIRAGWDGSPLSGTTRKRWPV